MEPIPDFALAEHTTNIRQHLRPETSSLGSRKLLPHCPAREAGDKCSNGKRSNSTITTRLSSTNLGVVELCADVEGFGDGELEELAEVCLLLGRRLCVLDGTDQDVLPEMVHL